MAIIGEIRKRSWIAVVVVGVAIAAFIIGDFSKKSHTMPTKIGEVDGTEISYIEFNAKLTELEEQFKTQNQRDPDAEERFQLQDQVWNTIVETRLYEGEYEKLGLVLSKAELNDLFYGDFVHPYILDIPAFKDPNTGAFNRQAVAQYIDNFSQQPKEAQMQWHELEKYIKTEQLGSKYATLVGKSLYFPLAASKYVSDIQNKGRNVRYVVAGYDKVADTEIKLTDADYEKFYNEHKEEYKQAARSRDLRFVVFPVTPSQEDLSNIQTSVEKLYEEFLTLEEKEIPSFITSESDVRYDSTYHKKGYFNAAIDSLISGGSPGQFISPRIAGNEWMMAKILKYDTRPDSVKVSQIVIVNNKAGEQISRTPEEAKRLSDSIFNELKTHPEAFEQFVHTYTDDPQSKEKGGDLGWMLDGMLGGAVGTRIIHSNFGEIFVEEIPNEMGYYIIKVTGKTEPIRKAQVALITRELQASDKTNKELLNKASQLAAEARTVDLLEEVSKKQGYAVHAADFTPEMAYRLSGVNGAREIVRWAYDKNTEKGTVAGTVFSTDDKYIVVGLKNTREKGYLTLEEVKPYVEALVKIEKKAELLISKANTAIAESKDINAIATKLGGVADTLEAVSFIDYTFGGNGPEMPVIGSIAAAKQGDLLKPIKGYNGVYVVKVDNVVDKPVSEPKAISMQSEMRYQQKWRNISAVLKDKRNVIDHRILFNY